MYKAFIQTYFCAFQLGIDPGLSQANFIDVIFPLSDYSRLLTFGFSFITGGWVSRQISYELKEGIEEIYCQSREMNKKKNRDTSTP